ncbi:ABC transporter ATP-binding protein [Fundicoccus sp. Sow4_D5]|uniref:ABC transporter ATP-binding protein n=1 Tax=Fundicoccus sp. Sow4_D5 TaxID=3438782 RepID=UPI003F904F7D
MAHTQPIISLKRVGFQINSKSILSDITLDIYEGDSIALVGPSGSGKSTLLKLIGSLLSPTEGRIQFKGADLSQQNPIDYRQEVSYFFQNAVLFDETVRDNLDFPAEIRQETFDEKRAIEGLEKVRLNATYLTKEIHELSGGEKQRIALVRNLMYMPRVLLLDEVTSSLDQINRDIILNYVRQLNEAQGTTLLWITHNNDDLQYFNRVLKVENGLMEEIK